ncbi:MAG: IS30 family transposase [Nocardioidaceae bacterium]
MTVRFSNQLVADLIQPFWAAWQAGEFMTDASAVAGTHGQRGLAWVRQAGGVRPRRGRGLQGRYLSFGEREEIALGRAGGESIRPISRRLGRSPSTISRELARNSDGKGTYRATTAHPLAYERAGRPKPAKLVTNVVLRARVELDLEKKYSPEQIAGRLRDDHRDDPEMWVSTETIYQSLYVQSRGALRRDLAKCLRTGRGLRQPNRQGAHRKSRVLPDMISIAERPAEADDRAVPGHWEGDLIIGKANASAIGTLVERTTGYTMLVHLPEGYKPAQVAPALAAKIQTLPSALRGSLTWDQGVEMRDWKQVRMATDLAIFFATRTPLAARDQRKHQWAAAAVFPQGHRPVGAQRSRPGLGRRRAQRQTPKTTSVQEADRTDRTAPVALTAWIRRSSCGSRSWPCDSCRSSKSESEGSGQSLIVGCGR